jgi:iron complex outermembrane receptor protein
MVPSNHACSRAWLASTILLTIAGAAAQQSQDITDLSLEELMNVKVVSASRKQTKLSQTAAAVYVITRDDIARSGAASIPELLRRVPGLHVAQVTASEWAISARGFTQQYSDKLLVMIDGRSIYTNLFSGVNWDQNTLPLEEIERIEVIRGPGATMWGANAVNGVINIITRDSADTQGGLASFSSGNHDNAASDVRYGGAIGSSIHYRAFADYFNRNQMLDANLQPGGDGYQMGQVGGRVDWKPTDRDTVLLESNINRGQAYELFEENIVDPNTKLDRLPINMFDTSFLGRWRRELDDKQAIEVQLSSSLEHREQLGGTANLNTLDLEIQHQVSLGARNNVLYGVGFRNTWDELIGGNVPGTAQFYPSHRVDRLFSSFAQDELTLVPDRLVFSAGTKVEHNDFTGWEVEPNARLLWTPGRRSSVWAAASRAVRTPNIVDDAISYYFQLPAPAPAGYVGLLQGNPNLRSEAMIAYEAGTRTQLGERFSIDLAMFRNRYSRLYELEVGAPAFTASGPLFPVTYANSGRAASDGFEFAATWKVARQWRIDGSYSWLFEDDLGIPQNGSNDTAPHHQVKIHSGWDFHRNFSADVEGFYLSSIDLYALRPTVRVNVNFLWHITPHTDFGFAMNNLTGTNQVQFLPQDTVQEMLDRRTGQLKMTWKF